MTSIQDPASSTAVFHASAPVRLDFAGGWSDVAPFAIEERGVVVNAAIGLRAEVELRTGGEGFLLHSDDLKDSLRLSGPESLAADGRLDLLKAALRRSGLGAAELRTRCAAPAGSGLGSSGALDVALVAALDAVRGIRRSRVDLAEEAFALESVEAALPGGRQDQYAAALGGFHRLVFERGAVSVEPSRLPEGVYDAAAHLWAVSPERPGAAERLEGMGRRRLSVAFRAARTADEIYVRRPGQRSIRANVVE